MTNILFFVNKNGFILGFDIFGHSSYSVAGNDIVCAAISSATYMVANTLTEIMNINADVCVNDAHMTLKIYQKDILMCQNILNGLKLHLLNLEEQYSDNISVNYKEV